MELATQVQILNEVVCVSLKTNAAIGKSLNRYVLPPPQSWINNRADWIF